MFNAQRPAFNSQRLVFKTLGFVPILFGFIVRLSAQFTPALLQNESYWGDGKAEFDLYDAQIMREGQPRHCEVLHILMRDTISPKQSLSFIKDSATAPLPVIRMNQILNVPVGIGVQQQSLSLFWNRDGGMTQFSFVGADSIGNTYKSCTDVPGANSFVYECHSYRDGTIEKELHRPAEQAIFYDELPFRVRTINFSKPSGDFEIQLAPTIVNFKNDDIVFKPAKINFRIGERAIDIEVRHNSGTDHFILDRDFPFLLREWSLADGSRLKMKNSLKISYWNYYKNGDRERALKDPMLRHPD